MKYLITMTLLSAIFCVSGCESKPSVVGESGDMTFEKYEELQRQSSAGMVEMPEDAAVPPKDAKKK